VGVPFLLLECRAPEVVLRERLRRRGSGPSDGREEILADFLRSFEPVTELAAAERAEVDASGALPDAAALRELLGVG
jgi:predicted kinase